jgi:hypothetical protein
MAKEHLAVLDSRVRQKPLRVDHTDDDASKVIECTPQIVFWDSTSLSRKLKKSLCQSQQKFGRLGLVICNEIVHARHRDIDSTMP